MDEVEAALDDVNLHRFLSLVEEFQADAQLLLVSRQKRTMEAADSSLRRLDETRWFEPGRQREGRRDPRRHCQHRRPRSWTSAPASSQRLMRCIRPNSLGRLSAASSRTGSPSTPTSRPAGGVRGPGELTCHRCTTRRWIVRGAHRCGDCHRESQGRHRDLSCRGTHPITTAKEVASDRSCLERTVPLRRWRWLECRGDGKPRLRSTLGGS